VSTSSVFPYRLDKRWVAIFKVLGVDEADGVTVTEDAMLKATYGRLSLSTPLSNIHHTEISGPHRWWTAVGARLSFADDGLTFGTNHHKGLCIEFIERVPKVLGKRDHSALWVSVADPEGLAAAITAYA
jgi:hypothetical protein